MVSTLRLGTFRSPGRSLVFLLARVVARRRGALGTILCTPFFPLLDLVDEFLPASLYTFFPVRFPFHNRLVGRRKIHSGN